MRRIANPSGALRKGSFPGCSEERCGGSAQVGSGTPLRPTPGSRRSGWAPWEGRRGRAATSCRRRGAHGGLSLSDGAAQGARTWRASRGGCGDGRPLPRRPRPAVRCAATGPEPSLWSGRAAHSPQPSTGTRAPAAPTRVGPADLRPLTRRWASRRRERRAETLGVGAAAAAVSGAAGAERGGARGGRTTGGVAPSTPTRGRGPRGAERDAQ